MSSLSEMYELPISTDPLMTEEFGMGDPFLVIAESVTGTATLQYKRRDGSTWFTEGTFDSTGSMQIVGCEFLVYRITLSVAGGSFFYQRLRYPYTGHER